MGSKGRSDFSAPRGAAVLDGVPGRRRGLDPGLVDRIRKNSPEYLDMATLVLAGYAVLLHNYTGDAVVTVEVSAYDNRRATTDLEIWRLTIVRSEREVL